MSSSRSTNDPDEEPLYHLYPSYNQGSMATMPLGQGPHSHYGAIQGLMPRQPIGFGAPQDYLHPNLPQHGDWGHDQNLYTLPAPPLEYEDDLGLTSPLRSLSLDSNLNPDARNDLKSATRNVHEDRAQGIWAAHPQQLPREEQSRDYASFQHHS